MISYRTVVWETQFNWALAQVWQNLTQAEDGPTLYLKGPLQARVNSTSYPGRKQTVRFTGHLPSLELTWSGIHATPAGAAAPVNGDLF